MAYDDRLRLPTTDCRPQLLTTDYHRLPPATTEYYRPLPTTTDYHRPLPNTTDHYRPPPTTTGHYRILPTTTDYHRLLPTTRGYFHRLLPTTSGYTNLRRLLVDVERALQVRVTVRAVREGTGQGVERAAATIGSTHHADIVPQVAPRQKAGDNLVSGDTCRFPLRQQVAARSDVVDLCREAGRGAGSG